MEKGGGLLSAAGWASVKVSRAFEFHDEKNLLSLEGSRDRFDF